MRRLGFNGCFVVNVVGRSGGLIMLWKMKIRLRSCTILKGILILRLEMIIIIIIYSGYSLVFMVV